MQEVEIEWILKIYTICNKDVNTGRGKLMLLVLWVSDYPLIL